MVSSRGKPPPFGQAPLTVILLTCGYPLRASDSESPVLAGSGSSKGKGGSFACGDAFFGMHRTPPKSRTVTPIEKPHSHAHGLTDAQAPK